MAESLRLTSELLANEIEISIQFGIASSATDTTVILKRATQLDRGDFEEIYRFDTSDQSESMAPGVQSNVTPNYFTITDELQTEGSAYYTVSAEEMAMPETVAATSEVVIEHFFGAANH